MAREEAIEILLDMANELQLIPESKQGQAFKMAIKALEQEERCMKDWTKCSSDNLPDMDVDVLGTTRNYGKVVKVARMETYLVAAGWEWVKTDDIEGNEYEPDEIIAWMPLPGPYKPESEES